MTALAANRQTERKDGDLLALPVGVDIIYQGSLVCNNASGYLVAGADTAGYRFQGVAYEKKDNSGGSAGDVECRVLRNGLFKFGGSGFTLADVGKEVFLADDQTVTLVPGNVFCGVIADYISATEAWIDIEPAVKAAVVDKVVVTTNIKTVADVTQYGMLFTCPAGRQATVLSAKVTALVKGVYATDELLNIYKYDLSATAAEAVLESADYDLDGLTALQAADLVLQTTTPANLDLEPGDTLYVAIATTGAQTTQGQYAVTVELALA